MGRIPSKICILVDDREQKPLAFPPQVPHVDRFRFPKTVAHYDSTAGGHRTHIIQVSHRTVHFPSFGLEGDYCIEGFEIACMIERKGCMGEVGKNMLTKDFNRQDRALRRLASATYKPCIYLDFPMTEQYLQLPDRRDRTDECLSQLFNVASRYGIAIFGGHGFRSSRAGYRAGAFVTQLMLSYALNGDPSCQLSPQSQDLSSQILAKVKGHRPTASSRSKSSPTNSTSLPRGSRTKPRRAASPTFASDVELGIQ